MEYDSLWTNLKGAPELSKNKAYPIFKVVYSLVKAFYPKTMPVNIEKIPDEPVVFVGNHTQMNGPIVCEIYFPVKRRTWCAAQMMDIKEVPEYAFSDFWSQKPRYTHPFYRLLSYIIAPFSAAVFTNAETIPVYHDHHTLTTFRETLNSLIEGTSVVIFPEHDVKHNHIVYDFQDGFVDIARMYRKKTGKELKFVPFYIAPKLRSFHFGDYVEYDSTNDAASERRRICDRLMDEITRIAVSLPEHTVVPYRNIPKKLYPSNRSEVSAK